MTELGFMVCSKGGGMDILGKMRNWGLKTITTMNFKDVHGC